MIVTFRVSSMGFGGAERVFLSLAGYLVQAHGAEVHFVVDQIGKGETEEVVRKHGYQLYGLSCARTAKSVVPLKKYIDRYRPHTLIAAYTDTNMAALLSARMAKHKCLTIVTEHASLDEHWRSASAKRRLMLNTYVRVGYRLADHVVAVSNGIARQIEQRLKQPEKVSCIHNPVRFSPARQSSLAEDSSGKAKTIVAVGRIARPKDYPTLLRAMRLVLARTNVRLVIVGGVHEPEEMRKLDQIIAASGLSGKVEFTGYTEQVEQYYRAADVFVLSSAWEGFGNVLVEALAFGLPVVSTNCNHGPAEILHGGRYGILVPVGDAEALADAIVRALVAPPPDRAWLRRRAEDFSESRIGAQYWRLIQQLGAAR